MSIQISIIGLGQIGASIGLALADHNKNIVRVGHDKDSATARAAKKLGAVDEIKRNLPNSVREADIIVLSLPLSEIKDTLGYIVQDLKEDAVILDTAPVKKAVQMWMQELLPAGRSYIGLVPVINPEYLHEKEFGVNAARADLFQNGVTMIAAPPNTSGETVQLAADLAQLLGSQPLFSDITEIDGLMSSIHLLPQLTAAALLNATVDHPGWNEARKLAGRPYAETTRASLHPESARSLSDAALLNGENTVRVLDGMIASLQTLKESISAEDKDALDEQLTSAEEGGLNWLDERLKAGWLFKDDKGGPSINVAGISERLFGIRQKKPRS
ncbi:MAG: prephenate dehydrogenase [Anaerolineae bacterium]|nr:prephenate dehydrogenase [Anaerolineae bacterium]